MQTVILSWLVKDEDAPRVIECVQVINELMVTVGLPKMTLLEVEKDDPTVASKPRRSKHALREPKT